MMDRIEFVISMLEAMRREGIDFGVALRVLRSGFGLDRDAEERERYVEEGEG